MNNLYGLILAGGSGTRLWPISRDYYPKQFLKLLGNKTLIQNTFARLNKIIPAENIFITTNRIFVDEIIYQLKEFGLDKKNIVIQPADKNTGPAIAQASKKIFDKDMAATIVTCPSDHLIDDEKVFISYLKSAYLLAQKGLLVTLGVRPTEPNPEYGYIKPKKAISLSLKSHKAYQIEKFIEKPSIPIAKKLIKDGSVWNSGIFIWKAKTIINEIHKFNKDFSGSLLSNKKYFLLKGASIDNSVLEKSDLVWIIPVSFDWKDIGSWKVLYELLPKDSNQNVLNNRVIAYNCHNSLIFGTDNRFVTAMDLNDTIVVDTKDYVLITPKDSTGGIKNLFNEIKTNILEENLHRPLISIIIPFYNDNLFFENTILSLLNQSYKNIEYIVIKDSTSNKIATVVDKYRYKIEQLVNMPNTNVFEKMNKGIEISNGEIVGILKSGDCYMDNKALEEVVASMENAKSDVAWGDLIYCGNKNSEKISMYWKSSPYKKGALQKGWIPPHSTFFVRKSVYQKYGSFNTKFNVAAEYELMLRLLEKYKVSSIYIPRVIIKMIGEGVSLSSIIDRFKGNFESYRSWKENNLSVNPVMLFSKNISRITQLWQKNRQE